MDTGTALDKYLLVFASFVRCSIRATFDRQYRVYCVRPAPTVKQKSVSFIPGRYD